MAPQLTRRGLLRAGVAGATALTFGGLGRTVASAFGAGEAILTVRRFEQEFAVPPELAASSSDATTDTYEITQRSNDVELVPGLRTQIWGYNGLFPGPTIRARSGRRVVVRQVNALSDPVSVHLHGGVQPPESDGYPTDLIPPGGTKEYVYPAGTRRAATLFYHDHAMNLTGAHVYRGLAGLYILEDDIEQALPLPRGEFDVPLILQDRSFRPDGTFAFDSDDPGNVFAETGSTVLVNGVPWPRFPVAARRYRLRLLNASGSTDYSLRFSGGQQMVQIGTDGGLLDRPKVIDRIRLAPAERMEVVVDFGDLALGRTVDLADSLGNGPVVRFEVSRRASEDSMVPQTLAPFERLTEAMAASSRTFVFQPQPRPTFPPFTFMINGQAFDPDVLAAEVPLKDVEVWRFVNRTPGLGPLAAQEHPVHVHLVNFLVLDRDGRPPAPQESGWKDTVVVPVNSTVRVVARFAPFTGKYVIHCHNLAHEDHAMMANFEVV